MQIEIKDFLLPAGEYFKEKHKKKSIWLHHTAGGHRPDWTIHGWKTDRTARGGRRPVATAFVIGGKSITNGDKSWDGKILRAFPEEYWAVHLGAHDFNLERESIGIEICNYGQLVLGHDGKFYNYVNKPVPETDVYEVPEPFRGYKYFHKYTDAQIESLRKLLLYLSNKFEIDLKKGLKEIIDLQKRIKRPEYSLFKDTAQLQQWLLANDIRDYNYEKIKPDGILGPKTKSALEKILNSPFELQFASKYQPGLWSHANLRADKTDVHPQPELIQMIESL